MCVDNLSASVAWPFCGDSAGEVGHTHTLYGDLSNSLNKSTGSKFLLNNE